MRLSHVCFGYDQPIFRDFSLDFGEQTITAVLGDSGVGKTTLLHLLSGLCVPQSGTADVRKVSYLFQQPRLLPSLNVLRNLTVLPSVSEEEARRWLTLVGLGDSLSLYPRQLSGGMAQRVALARAFAVPCDVLLMDEPFKGLDLALQDKLQQLFLELWCSRKPTTVLITHDVDEALALAQRLVVLRSRPVAVVCDVTVTAGDAPFLREKVREALLQEQSAR